MTFANLIRSSASTSAIARHRTGETYTYRNARQSSWDCSKAVILTAARLSRLC